MPNRFPFIFISCLTVCCLGQSSRTLQESIRRLDRRLRAENVLAVLVKSAGSPQVQDGVQALGRSLHKLLGNTANPRLPRAKLEALITVSDALAVLLLAHENQRSPQSFGDEDFKAWLLLKASRRLDFLNHINLQRDHVVPAVDILWRLYCHDPQQRHRTWPLMLAMALVWDAPRPPLHDQIGPGRLDFTAELPQRYDHFKRLFLSGKAPWSLDELSISALCFVVDTPVPVSELAWAIEHEKERNPQDLFQGIRYDRARYAEAASYTQFSPDRTSGAGKSSLFWPYGSYTLQNIRNHGGLCTDQAYYTSLVLKARGIPAFLMVGMGRRGGHAWVAYLKTLKTWKTDVGRSDKDSYTTGYAFDPQTGEPFNDHVLPLVCRKSTATRPGRTSAQALTRLAFVLQAFHCPRAARTAAELAIDQDPLDLQPWHLLMRTQNSESGRLKVLTRQAEAFQDYPDLVTAFKLRQVQQLRQRGRSQAASRILEGLPQDTRKRDDLQQHVTWVQINKALEDQKPQQARQLLERHLKANKREAAKLLNDIRSYLNLTRETEQTQEAVRFLEGFVRSLRRSFNRTNDGDPRYQNWDTLILIKAYENNGQHKKAQRLKKQLER